jgi:hypothetical protein
MVNALSEVFKNQRWEARASEHVYWLDEPMLHELSGSLSAILTGSRGTGKTTLLNSLSLEQRLTNRWLSKQHGGKFEDGLLGLYVKLPLQHFDRLHKWTQGIELEAACDWMAFYLDLIWLEVLGKAIDLLHRAAHIEDLVPLDKVAAELLAELRRSPAGAAAMTDCPETAISVLGRLHDLRRSVEFKEVLRADPLQSYVDFAVPRVGELGRTWGARFASAFDHAAPREGTTWRIKVLMDEAETLQSRHQIAANSILRLAQDPVSYVFSYVSLPDDTVSTCFPGLTLSNADRRLVPRDDMSDSDFERMCQEIVNARIRALTDSDDPEIKFDLVRVVGGHRVEDVLESHFSETVGRNAVRLIGDGKSDGESVLRRYIAAAKPQLRSPDALDDVPSTEPEDSAVAVRRDESANYRKIKVAAYLSLCTQYNWVPRYAGKQMILQMSDQCIRDFLLQMDALMKGSGREAEAFLSGGPMPIKDQNRLLRRASADKVKLASGKVRTRPHETSMLIQGLAYTTRELQSYSRNGVHLSQPERGRFRIDFSGDTAARQENTRMVREAVEAGYLKLHGTPKDDEIVFRVHNSLAANFNFSYRGAYVGVLLPIGLIQDFRRAESPAVLKSIARRFVRGMRQRENDPQGLLFDAEGES